MVVPSSPLIDTTEQRQIRMSRAAESRPYVAGLGR